SMRQGIPALLDNFQTKGMDLLRITGPSRLVCEVAASGSKNAALPIMAAALLTKGRVQVSNVPRLTDVATLARLMRGLGMAVEQVGNEVSLEEVDRGSVLADRRLMSRMRASFCVLGPLLARRGRAIVPLPGGCRIGDRPVDLHLNGLSALGAQIDIRQGHVVARARRLTGANVHLTGPRGPTVTGTANVLSAAALARGTTVITGAACEPEIVDLGRFLEKLGAKIAGLGSETITVDGVEELSGGEYTVIPDRIETATLLLAAAITRGSIRVTATAPQHLAVVLDAISHAGAAVETTADSIRLVTHGRPRLFGIVARPYPGFPTDLQAQWTTWMCLAAGRSTIRDAVFPKRFAHLAELRRLGANVVRCGSSVRVTGVAALRGNSLTACDLRASAALVLAALAAEGETMIRGAHHLDRGYERLDEKLASLGADIARCRVGQASLRARAHRGRSGDGEKERQREGTAEPSFAPSLLPTVSPSCSGGPALA
ncbi:MAG: UDP-N-acetylglucosamine 1-carboxyvinyltransferase, partial [Pirellulales bacterium]